MPISGGWFVSFVGAIFAFGMCGIILVARSRIKAYLAGVVTAVNTSPAVVVDDDGVRTGGTYGRELAIEIADAGL